MDTRISRFGSKSWNIVGSNDWLHFLPLFKLFSCQASQTCRFFFFGRRYCLHKQPGSEPASSTLPRWLLPYYPPRLTGCLDCTNSPPELPRRPPRDAPDSSTDDAKQALLIQGGDKIAFLDRGFAVFRDGASRLQISSYVLSINLFACLPTDFLPAPADRPTDRRQSVTYYLHVHKSQRPSLFVFVLLKLSCSTSAESFPPLRCKARYRLHSPWWRTRQPLSTTAQRYPSLSASGTSWKSAHLQRTSFSCDVLRN